MKAITIQQPWALAIAAGVKNIENRSRHVSYRGPVAIHAGAAWSREGAADPRIRAWWLGRTHAERQPQVDAADLATGWMFRHIIAVVDLVDCHEADQSMPAGASCCPPWGDRQYKGRPAWHLALANARRLDTPVPVVLGCLALPWTLSDDVAAQVEREVASCCSF